jgi:hypothetical protein
LELAHGLPQRLVELGRGAATLLLRSAGVLEDLVHLGVGVRERLEDEQGSALAPREVRPGLLDMSAGRRDRAGEGPVVVGERLSLRDIVLEIGDGRARVFLGLGEALLQARHGRHELVELAERLLRLVQIERG